MIRKLGLDDYFLRKLLHVQKSSLGTGSIEPSIEIDMLEIKLHEGNKRLKGKSIKLIAEQEELSFIDSRLTKEGRKRNTRKMHWKEGRIEEVENRLNVREIKH